MEIADYFIEYIYDNKLKKNDLIKIDFPSDLIQNLPNELNWNDKEILNLRDYLEDLEDDMAHFLYYESIELGGVEKIKLSKILKQYNLPICAFWLDFIVNVKHDFIEGIYS